MSNSTGFFRSVVDTLWLYPRSNVESVFTTTSVPYRRVGSVITFGSIADIETFASDLYASTITGEFPQGFNVGVGSLLRDNQRRIIFCLPDGHIFMIMGEVTLLTDQTTIPSGGDAPQGTQGYLTTYLASGNDVGKGYDPVRVVRTG